MLASCKSPRRRQLRSVFLSDVHLGTRGCNAELLLEFLRSVETRHLYLVGDIIDLERLARRSYWPRSHAAVLRELLRHAASGARVIYIPGNHDAALRAHAGLIVGGIEIRRRHVHTTRDGKQLLIVHGDELAPAVPCGRLLHALGASLYVVVLCAHVANSDLRRRLGLGYWSLAGFVKGRIARVGRYLRHFECAAARAARRENLDGIVCGHVHRARLARVNGILYCNDGDWVESCSSLVEHADGRLELLRWTGSRGRSGGKLDAAAVGA